MNQPGCAKFKAILWLAVTGPFDAQYSWMGLTIVDGVPLIGE